MKRLTIIAIVALLVVVLFVPVAGAAKKKKKKKPSASSGSGLANSFDVAVDLGLPVAGFVPYGSFNVDGEDAGSFGGVGSIGFPYLGLHAALYPARDWYIQFGVLTYLRQGGEGTYRYDDEDLDDQDFDYVINRFCLVDAGLGKIFGKNKRIRPKAGAGLGVHYVSFSDEDADDSATGWAVGPYGLVGVDFDVTKLKGMGQLFIGANLRLDLIWNWAPYEMDDNDVEVSMVYLPLSAFLSTGLRF